MAEEPRRGPPVVEIVLPTYITKPGEDEKFYPSEVKAIAEKVSEIEASRIGRMMWAYRSGSLRFWDFSDVVNKSIDLSSCQSF